MKQINFRIEDDFYQILSLIAAQLKVSIAEISKQFILDKMSEKRLEISLQLYQQGKIGLKKAWRLSGLTAFEFRRILIEKNIEPVSDPKTEDQALENALQLDLDQLEKP